MKFPLLLSSLLVPLCLLRAQTAPPAQLKLTAPLEHQVIQRSSKDKGSVRIAGSADASVVEARIGSSGDWKRLDAKFEAGHFTASLDAPAGGWFRLEVRALEAGTVTAAAAVEHLGIGEVFIVAGQSNSANHGAEKQHNEGSFASFDGRSWHVTDDPQPGASGNGGSFMPPLGNAQAAKFGVPVGFIPCGIGATSVREWLPKGATFPNPPTIESRVQKFANGEWESKGQAYETLVQRMKAVGPKGFRAVLWHQGESDANQKDTTRTLPGKLYREYLEKIIRTSRQEIGWEAPWFVAQVSYHVPGDEASPDIRAAQASLWKDGVAFEGPDSDALKGDLRERNGQGVHFSAAGLREHGARWAAQIIPWLEKELK
ncbi:sialate O-acetylesterase [Prosthecobacter sp.]|uniref:sialate O-acetylesterase n=1 Tax=Prosthecobacter sp. TaxID=1965333 RepID=UPI003784F60B